MQAGRRRCMGHGMEFYRQSQRDGSIACKLDGEVWDRVWSSTDDRVWSSTDDRVWSSTDRVKEMEKCSMQAGWRWMGQGMEFYRQSQIDGSVACKLDGDVWDRVWSSSDRVKEIEVQHASWMEMYGTGYGVLLTETKRWKCSMQAGWRWMGQGIEFYRQSQRDGSVACKLDGEDGWVRVSSSTDRAKEM